MTPVTLLVVDDDPGVLDVLEGLLAAGDRTIVLASSGEEALASAEALTPDLVLLDVAMPGMDGLEVCRRLRAHPRLAEVPVIMVTGEAVRLRALEAGADDFVGKPFDPVELEARVRSVTRLNRYRRLLAERTKLDWVIAGADDGYVVLGAGDAIAGVNPRARLLLGLEASEREAGGARFLEVALRQWRCEPAEAWATWPQAARTPRFLLRPESATATAMWLCVDVLEAPGSPSPARVVRLKDVTADVTARRDMLTFHRLVAHKLRAPATQLLMGLERLCDAATLPAEEIADLADMGLRSGRRLRDQIEDVLRFVEAAGAVQPHSRCAVSAVPAVVARVAADLGLHRVAVSVADGIADLRIALPERALEIVLFELFENAQKFHPETAPAVEVRITRAEGRGVVLTVADDGLTLSPEQLARAGTPYWQGEKWFTGEAAGMGLGLSTVAAVVWEAGGTCQIMNRDGAPGVVVELRLPRRETSDPSPA